MTTRKAVAVTVEAAEIEFAEAVKGQNAPMVQRLATHRDRVDQAIKELESERFEFQSRLDLIRRQAEAVEQGINMHLADIDATLALYETGMNNQKAVD